MKAARAQFTLVLGEQLSAFLGEYSSSAAEQAAGYVLNKSNRPTFRAARRKLGTKLLDTPINELVALNQLEMAILRDTVWSAVQEFRLPNEDALLDALYIEFGAEPFAILLPTTSQAERGDAPLYEAGRDVLQGTLTKFLASPDWREWLERAPALVERGTGTGTSTGSGTGTGAVTGVGREEADSTAMEAPHPSDTPADATPEQASPPAWDGWD